MFNATGICSRHVPSFKKKKLLSNLSQIRPAIPKEVMSCIVVTMDMRSSSSGVTENTSPSGGPPET